MKIHVKYFKIKIIIGLFLLEKALLLIYIFGMKSSNHNFCNFMSNNIEKENMLKRKKIVDEKRDIKSNEIKFDHFDDFSLDSSSKHYIEALLHIMIISSPSNIVRRNLMRKTWLQNTFQYKQISYNFLICDGISDEVRNSLNIENNFFKDIVFLQGCEEHYTKLPKKVLKAILWAASNVNSTYVMKADDDVYIILERLIKIISSSNIPKERLIMGNIFVNSEVVTIGKVAELNWLYCPTYFPYAGGAGYIISRDLTLFVASNKAKLKMYNNEDVSLGNWLSPVKTTIIYDEGVIYDSALTDCLPNHWLLLLHGGEDIILDIHEKWVMKHNLC